MLKKDKYNGIELNKWYRHRGSLTVPKRIKRLIKLDSAKEVIIAARYRNGQVYKMRSQIDYLWEHFNCASDIMAYRFITKKKEEGKK